MAVSFLIAKTTGQCTVRQETAFHAITLEQASGLWEEPIRKEKPTHNPDADPLATVYTPMAGKYDAILSSIRARVGRWKAENT